MTQLAFILLREIIVVDKVCYLFDPSKHVQVLAQPIRFCDKENPVERLLFAHRGPLGHSGFNCKYVQDLDLFSLFLPCSILTERSRTVNCWMS